MNWGPAVVEEGVETVAQQRMLQGVGCDQAQGYLFSRPLPATRFGELRGAELTTRVHRA